MKYVYTVKFEGGGVRWEIANSAQVVRAAFPKALSVEFYQNWHMATSKTRESDGKTEATN